MHVLLVTHGYKPAYRIGGPIVSVAALAEGLVARGNRVTVFTTNSNLDEDLDVPTDVPVDVEGVAVHYFRRTEPLKPLLSRIPYFSRSIGLLHTPAMKPALAALLPSVDLVHTQMPFVSPTRIAGRAALAAGKPLFYHQRGVFDPARLAFRSAKKRAYIALVERPLMRRATTLFALTQAEEASYRALGVTTPVEVVPNGIDTGSLRTAPAAPLPGIAEDAQVVLFLARLHETKGADLLLAAFARIAAQFPKAVLVLGGPDESGLEESYRVRLTEAGLADRVRFPGMLTGEAKRDWLARADLFCLPSVAEGLSMAMLEALGSGTAVLLSPGCHFPQAETAGAGRIAERSEDAWVAALTEMLSQPQRLREMGIRARGLVERDYAWPGIVRRIEAAYKAGLSRRHAP